MKLLLILFVIALALAPLGNFLPSKRQRKIARLREYAATHGLFVEFRDTPGTPASQDRAGGIIYYGKRLPGAIGDRVEKAAWRLSDAEWIGVQTRQPLPSSMRELPVEILAVGIDGTSCGVYWTESGEVEAVEHIRQALEAWAAELAG